MTKRVILDIAIVNRGIAYSKNFAIQKCVTIKECYRNGSFPFYFTFGPQHFLNHHAMGCLGHHLSIFTFSAFPSEEGKKKIILLHLDPYGLCYSKLE